MRKIAIVCLALMFVVCACEPAPPPPPPAPPPPPPPSPQEIAAEIRPCLGPYQALVTTTVPGQGTGSGGQGAFGSLSAEQQKQTFDCLAAAKSKHQVTENGKEALGVITHELEDLIKVARDQHRWKLVLGCIESHAALAGPSEKYKRLKEHAEKELRRPVVRVKGFFDDEDNKQTYVFLQFELKPSGEVIQERMRVGEEKHMVKFLEIIGNRKGVRLEYTELPGTIWDAMAP